MNPKLRAAMTVTTLLALGCGSNAPPAPHTPPASATTTGSPAGDHPADEGTKACLPLAVCGCITEECVGGVAYPDGLFRATTGPQTGRDLLHTRECTAIGGALSCHFEYVDASMACTETCRPTYAGFSCAWLGDDCVVR
ncbi:MAG: hypothetical protein HY907_20845 [Deltaproteobacteria bacterium]|nr:hypothetical protein [Deltaproteobacteria bacterium]